MPFELAAELLATEGELAALQLTIEPKHPFTSADYSLLNRRLGHFAVVRQTHRRGVRTTVFDVGPEMRLAVVRLPSGPLFVLERALLADRYIIDVLGDLLRSAIGIAAERDVEGHVVIRFIARNAQRRIGRLKLPASLKRLQSFTLQGERLNTAPKYRVVAVDRSVEVAFGDVGARRQALFARRSVVHEIAKQAGISKRDAVAATTAIVKHISETCQRGDRCAIPGLGTFAVLHRRAREGRNPRTNDKITISASKSVRFKAAKNLREAINDWQRGVRFENRDLDPEPIAKRWRVAAEMPKANTTRLVDVFYATDRKRTGKADPYDYYGYGQARELTLGVCRVTIPPSPIHQTGRVETPSIWKLRFRPDPRKHIVLSNIKEMDVVSFYRRLADVIADDDRRQVFIFVHGYNVTFADAARRTAQIHVDIKFPGAPILYSWPSRGVFAGYAYDSERVKATRERFACFVGDVWHRTGVEEIHVIAHSMGNRVVAAALESIGLGAVDSKPPFDQIVLAAPDLDVEDFTIAVERMKGLGKRLTLYGSSRDKAIVASKKFLFEQPRAGEGGSNLVIIDGLDSIDASLIDTDFLSHSYIADSPRLLNDLHKLVNDNSSPAGRFGIEPRESGGWIFVKQTY